MFNFETMKNQILQNELEYIKNISKITRMCKT